MSTQSAREKRERMSGSAPWWRMPAVLAVIVLVLRLITNSGHLW